MEIISTALPELKTLAGLTGKKSELQAIQFLLLNAKDGDLTATGSDFEVGMTLKLNAQVLGEGALVAPPSLAELLSDGQMINLASEKNKLKVDKDGFKGILNCLPAAEYPPVPAVGQLTNAFSINAQALGQLLSVMPFAMKKDLGNGTNGLFLAWKGEKARAIAVDGIKAAMASTQIKSGVEDKVLLTASGIQALQKFISYHNPDETIRCGMVNDKFAARSPIGAAWANSMNGIEKFPAEAVVKTIMGLAKGDSLSGTVNIKQLRYAVNQIKTILSAKDNPNSWFVFGSQQITISVNDAEVGGGTAVVDMPMDEYKKEVRHAYNLNLIETTLIAFDTFVDGDTCPISVSIDPNTGLSLQAQHKTGVAACMVKPVAPSAMRER